MTVFPDVDCTIIYFADMVADNVFRWDDRSSLSMNEWDVNQPVMTDERWDCGVINTGRK